MQSKLLKTLFIYTLLCVSSSFAATDQYTETQDEKEFSSRIEKFVSTMAPQLKERFGNKVNLVALPSWQYGSFDAHVKVEGNDYNMLVYSGVFKAPYMTPDAFSLVLCHEFSHIMSGAPYKSIEGSNLNSNEGQSDYLTNLKCMRRLFNNDDNLSLIKKLNVPPIVNEKCHFVFKNPKQAAICIRNSMAALSFSRALAYRREMLEMPTFATQDSEIVYNTKERWPSPQCRLDTLFQAALCDKNISDKVNNDSPFAGTCNRAEGYKLGVRPRCWYEPKELSKNEAKKLGVVYKKRDKFKAKSTFFDNNQVEPLVLRQENEFQSLDSLEKLKYDFSSIIALPNCSGSIIRFEDSKEEHKALLLTNGHCVKMGGHFGKFPAFEQVFTDVKQLRHVQLFNRSGERTIPIDLKKLVYATMTDTDIAIYELDQSYRELKQDYFVQPLTLSKNTPEVGDKVKVISGDTGITATCIVDKLVPKLKEASWVWKDSYRLKDSTYCQLGKGVSGSPLIDFKTNKVVGVYNTSNQNGATDCKVNAPCEVEYNQEIAVKKGLYAQQTAQIYSCLDRDSKLDFNQRNCLLPKNNYTQSPERISTHDALIELNRIIKALELRQYYIIDRKKYLKKRLSNIILKTENDRKFVKCFKISLALRDGKMKCTRKLAKANKQLQELSKLKDVLLVDDPRDMIYRGIDLNRRWLSADLRIESPLLTNRN